MGAGLIDIAAQTRQQGMQGLSDVAKLEQNRQVQSDQNKSQLKQAQKATVGSMAGTGAAIGTAFMPGIGTAVGAGIGALAGVVMNYL